MINPVSVPLAEVSGSRPDRVPLGSWPETRVGVPVWGSADRPLSAATATTATPGRTARATEDDRAVITTDATPATGEIPATGAGALKLIDATPAVATTVPGTLAGEAVKITEEDPGSAETPAPGALAVNATEAVPGSAPAAV